MDINAIIDNIEELENASTTVDNVKELASLYIVRKNYKNGNLPEYHNKSTKELEDILPQYSKYIEIKRQYQLGNVSEQAVRKAIRRVCKEIFEFINTLYSCTDMKDERDCIRNLISTLSDFKI